MKRPDLEALQQLARQDDWHRRIVGSDVRVIIAYALQAEADRAALAKGLDAISDILDGMIEGASREETKEALFGAAVQAWNVAACGTFRPNEWWRPFAEAHATPLDNAQIHLDGARAMQEAAVKVVETRLANCRKGIERLCADDGDCDRPEDLRAARSRESLYARVIGEIRALDPDAVGNASLPGPAIEAGGMNTCRWPTCTTEAGADAVFCALVASTLCQRGRSREPAAAQAELHYSGPLSEVFWARVAAIVDPAEHAAAYALGVMLQNNEAYVLRQLAQSEAPRG